MQRPYFPFYFRGIPKDPEQARLLEGALTSGGVDMTKRYGLPESLKVRKQYRSDMSDAQVFELYPSDLVRKTSAMFIRLIPVIPYSYAEGAIGSVVQFLGERFVNIDRNPLTAKQIIFFEQESDRQRFDDAYRVESRSGKDWIRACDYGLVFLVPLYDQNQTRGRQGHLREFLEQSNDELAKRYQSIVQSPPSSSRRK